MKNTLYQVCTPKLESEFIKWINETDWAPVLAASGSDEKAMIFQKLLDDAMDAFFPRRTGRRREGDLPWMNEVARKKAKRKRRIYQEEGRSRRWWEVLEDLEKYLDEKQENFLTNQRGKLISSDSSKQFYKNVKIFKSADKPKEFNLRDLKPELNYSELANDMEGYFHRISNEFEPLTEEEILRTHNRVLPKLQPCQVADRMRAIKKPTSRVEGDIFPKLVNDVATSLCDIYNVITSSKMWPKQWKTEYVTAIPKKAKPETYNDLRNIS